MGKDEKLIERIETNPIRSDIRFNELKQYLENYGFEHKKNNGGSHRVFRHSSKKYLRITIPVHDKNSIVKKAYVLEAIEVVARLKEEGVEK